MTALDTNVVVRFLVRDDESQAQAVYRRLKQAEAEREVLFIPLLVLLEVVWVLGSAYGKSRSDILDSIDDLKRMPVLRFEADGVVQGFLAEAQRTTVDLPDILIAHSAAESGCSEGLTFDKKAAKLAFFQRLAQKAQPGRYN